MTTGAVPPVPSAALAHLAVELEELKAAHLYRPLRVMSTANRTRVTVDGRDVISLASNNYLGLNTHPRLLEAAERARRLGAARIHITISNEQQWAVAVALLEGEDAPG